MASFGPLPRPNVFTRPRSEAEIQTDGVDGPLTTSAYQNGVRREYAPRLKNRLDFCRKGRIAMGAGRWTWPPGETLRARPMICGALGRASVNSGAANQRSP